MPTVDHAVRGRTALPTGTDICHRFHICQGRNVRFSENRTVATRVTSFSDGLVFSEESLRPNELFLVEVERNDLGWNGSLRIGITETGKKHNNILLYSKYQVMTSYTYSLSFVGRSI